MLRFNYCNHCRCYTKIADLLTDPLVIGLGAYTYIALVAAGESERGRGGKKAHAHTNKQMHRK